MLFLLRIMFCGRIAAQEATINGPACSGQGLSVV
jgi:hypothetical protein